VTLLDRLGAALGAGLRVLSIVDGGLQAAPRVGEYIGEHGLAGPGLLPVLLDDGRVASLYQVTTIPHLVVVDRGGTIRHVAVGGRSEGELAEWVARLL
jgi:hypothetical protein